jgi:hypothetical protein
MQINVSFYKGIFQKPISELVLGSSSIKINSDKQLVYFSCFLGSLTQKRRKNSRPSKVLFWVT